MESVEHASIEVERCTWCQGLWFDMLEAERLKELKAAGYLDVGDAIQGEEYNLTAAANCPKCQVKLIPMVDAKQPHIWYESCPQCYGVFFDAGEFTDYQEETILDFFKGLLAKDRG
jgi:Zn-finger nucleic acid-binding protein